MSMNNTFGKQLVRRNSSSTDDHCSMQLAFMISTILGTKTAD